MHLLFKINTALIFYATYLIGVTVSTTTSNSETVRSHPCIKRDNHIYCPFNGAQMPSLHRAADANSSLSRGPAMYRRRFTVPKTVNSGTEHRPVFGTQLHSHVHYYTKQFDDRAVHKHDLNDQDEHEFMHSSQSEQMDHVLDDGTQVHRAKRHRMSVFIDENKGMIRRMFGTHGQDSGSLLADGGDLWHPESSGEHFSSFHDNIQTNKSRRSKRTLRPSPLLGGNNKVDSCDSSVEIVTPYWASNSAGKIRAIVNTQHLQQAIQQEVCQAVQTKYCNKSCTCEQKYKWHRLLAYDPDDDCKGIFMDWFLFPSCCVCRCTKF